ncbi:MAG: Holliday junction branch migration protein RuvA [Steroidobacteraceae bacterium]
MIGSLTGMLVEKDPQRLLIEVQGVGFEVETPMSTFLALPAVGKNLRLRIHQVLREDASLLFGFASEDERALFRALLKVNGVGPRMALAILSGVSADAFQQAVAGDDLASLTRIPGVGRKTAERLLIEMRDYFKALPISKGGLAEAPTPRGEALHALQALGYKPQEAQRMLDSATSTDGTTEDLIRAALQGVAPKQGRP